MCCRVYNSISVHTRACVFVSTYVFRWTQSRSADATDGFLCWGRGSNHSKNRYTPGLWTSKLHRISSASPKFIGLHEFKISSEFMNLLNFIGLLRTLPLLDFKEFFRLHQIFNRLYTGIQECLSPWSRRVDNTICRHMGWKSAACSSAADWLSHTRVHTNPDRNRSTILLRNTEKRNFWER